MSPQADPALSDDRTRPQRSPIRVSLFPIDGSISNFNLFQSGDPHGIQRCGTR